MREECEEQTDLTVWVNKDERIVTFRDTEGFENSRSEHRKRRCLTSITCVSLVIGYCKEEADETII